MPTERAASARAFWITGPETCEIRAEEVDEPAAGEVLVEALYSGVSRGTESLVFRGLVPESEHERMRAPHQAGRFSFPIKYGYASVGRVVRGRADLVGQTVFCLYPHQTRYVVPAESVVPLPADVPAKRAVLAANMETAVNGLWDAQPRVGDRIAVVGGGAVGCLVAYLASRIAGCSVELVDVAPQRAETAVALGVEFAPPDRARAEADLVVHASGSPAGLETALALAGEEATVLELSWFGARRVELSLGGAFHSRRLRLRSSQVGAISPSQRPRWTHRRRLSLALSLLRDPGLDVLVSGESRFEDLPAEARGLLVTSGSAQCHRVRYPGTA